MGANNKPVPLPAGRIEDVRRLWLEGVPRAAMAYEFKVSEKAITRWAQKLGLPSRKSSLRGLSPPEKTQAEALRKEGKRVCEIATILGRSPSCISHLFRYVRERGKPGDPVQGGAKTRDCLYCRRPFLSSWAGERICSHCKGNSAFQGGVML